MEGTSRIYQRKKYSIPFTYTAQEYPPVASSTQPLPLSDAGIFIPKKYSGTLKNSSIDGFCFEAEKSLSPGTEIITKMISPITIHLQNAELSEGRSIVKWCHKNDKDSEASYDIGVKRVRDETLPIFNFDKQGFGSVKIF